MASKRPRADSSQAVESTGKRPKDTVNLDWGTTKAPNDLLWALLTALEKDDNRVVLFGKRKNEKSTGDTKVAAYQRIAQDLFPEAPAGSAELRQYGNRIKNKVDALKKNYTTKVKRITCTGGGVRSGEDETEDEPTVVVDIASSSDDSNEYLRCYIGPEGPDDATPAEYCNIWDQIQSEFPPFTRLHALLATRPNTIPPAVTTGTGPVGHKTVHYQPPDGHRVQAHAAAPPATPEPQRTQASEVEPPASGRVASGRASRSAPPHLSPEKLDAVRAQVKPVSRNTGIYDILRDISQKSVEAIKAENTRKAVKDIRSEIQALRDDRKSRQDQLLQEFKAELLSREEYREQSLELQVKTDAAITQLNADIKAITSAGAPSSATGGQANGENVAPVPEAMQGGEMSSWDGEGDSVDI